MVKAGLIGRAYVGGRGVERRLRLRAMDTYGTGETRDSTPEFEIIPCISYRLGTVALLFVGLSCHTKLFTSEEIDLAYRLLESAYLQ